MTSEWVFEDTIIHGPKTYHLWSQEHRDGYTVYTLTHQPDFPSGVDFVKPQGHGCFATIEALISRTGIIYDKRRLA